MALLRATLRKPLRRDLENGHPWIFDRAVQLPARAEAGDVVRIVDERGEVAFGIADPRATLAVRVLGLAPSSAAWDASWVKAQLRGCHQLRMAMPELADTNAYRLVHGENDGCPGLVIDRYDDTAVIVLDGDGPARFWQARMTAITATLESLGVRGCWLKHTGNAARVALGQPRESVQIHEGRAQFEVSLTHGQKTGFFLDQRPNRLMVGSMAGNRTVLNLFAYTGGFSLHAALGGASAVTSVDIARPASDACRRNAQLNGIQNRFDVHTQDAYEFLAEAQRSGRRWELVIVDPPSFAPNERSLARAAAAYTRLYAMALSVVAPQGLFAPASCSSHLRRAAWLELVGAAASEAERRLLTLLVHGAGADHPVRAGFAEGEYLKFAVCSAPPASR